MTDAAERAEKAARAKALLKKRQQQKASGNYADGGASSPRTGSPAPVPVPSTPPPPNFANSPSNNSPSLDIQDASILFGKPALANDTGFGEFGVLAPSPLRPMPSPVALGRAVSSPSPVPIHNNQHQPYTPGSPVFSRMERRTSTPVSAPPPQVPKGPTPSEIELQNARSKYEAEIAQLNADLKSARADAAKEAEALRNEVRQASSQAKEAQTALESSARKVNDLQTALSRAQEELANLHSSSTTQQQTITLLVNEKTALVDQVAELGPLQSKLSESEGLLSEAHSQVVGLQERLDSSEREKINMTTEMKTLKSRLQISEQNEQSLREQLRALEVDLDDNQRALAETQQKLEERENELRIMKEDDRVEVLEQALSASRERIEELGESLTRLQENLTAATQNGDNLTAQLKTLTEEKGEHVQRYSNLEANLSSVNEELTQLRRQHQTVSEERAHFQKELDTSRDTITSFQQQMSTLSANLASRTRHHDELELHLSTTSRKLADTETSLQALRSENMNLLAQLEEVRPKLVELANKGAEDEERISSRDRKIHGLEKEVVTLETDLHDVRLQLENAEVRIREEQENVDNVQAEKAEVEHEVAQSKKAHDELETVVAQLREDIAKMKDEWQETERISTQLMQERDMQRAEISSLKIELDHARLASEELQKSEADSNEVLEGMRAELESLREQLFEKDQEVSNLRASAATAPSSKDQRSGHTTSPSLSDELFSSIRDQHALDMSDAQSRIRELESEVFAAKANEHTQQKRIAALEDELGQMLRQSRAGVREASTSGNGRRSISTTDTRPHTPSSLSQSRHSLRAVRPRVVYEENLSNDIRRKRKISLGMLKARIESERAAGILSMTGIGLGMSTGSPLSRVSSIVEIDEGGGVEGENNGVGGYSSPRRGSQTQSQATSAASGTAKHAPRYHLKGWDESHIFWCHACKGDLVVL